MRMPVIRSAKLRKVLGVVIPFVAIPLAVLLFSLHSASYSLSMLLVTIMALILFLCGFERRKTGTRRMILVAVLTALSVVGRFVFGVIPAFKPITAITVITAVYLGGEAGFLCGALSALISNFYFGQGPWTPFQMLSWGLIGLFAGLLSCPLRRSRLLLSLYGVLSGVLYSLVMDFWTVLWYNDGFNSSMYLASFTASLPFSVTYAVSNVIFLNLIARPFGEKLDRVRIKYGC